MHDDKSEGLFSAANFNLPRGAFRLNRESGPTSLYIAWLPNPLARVPAYLRRIAGVSCAAAPRRESHLYNGSSCALCTYSFKRETSFRRVAVVPVQHRRCNRSSRWIAREINKVSLRKRQPVPVRARSVSKFQAIFTLIGIRIVE